MIFNMMKRLFFILVVLIAVLSIAGCEGKGLSAPDINAMMRNLQQNFQPIVRLVFAVAYITGIWFIYSAVHSLRAYGEVRTMMPSNAEMSGPLVKLFIGAMLLFLPTMLDVSAYTLWGAQSGGWEPTGGKYEDVLRAVMGLVQIVGYIAFVRGLVMMAKSAQKGAQPGMFGKGMTHLIGGLLAVNIKLTLGVIRASVGL